MQLRSQVITEQEEVKGSVKKSCWVNLQFIYIYFFLKKNTNSGSFDSFIYLLNNFFLLCSKVILLLLYCLWVEENSSNITGESYCIRIAPTYHQLLFFCIVLLISYYTYRIPQVGPDGRCKTKKKRKKNNFILFFFKVFYFVPLGSFYIVSALEFS